MSNRKATNKGTCQVCGCVQKLPAKRLSLHGYTTRWGFFQGTCTGSEHQPFEESKDLIEGAIRRAQVQAEEIKARQVQLRAPVADGTTKAWVAVYFPCRSRGDMPSHTRYVELECYAKDHTSPSDASYKWTGFYHKAAERAGQDMGERNRQLCRYDRSPKTLEEAITIANSGYAASMNKTLEQIASYVAWQKKRIAGWKPQPLLPL